MTKKEINELDLAKIWDVKYKTGSYPWMGQSIPTQILKEFINKFNKDDLILDYACGDGYFSKILQNADLKIIGADISKEALKLAKQNSPQTKFYQVSNPISLKEKHKFKGIFAWGILHHIEKEQWRNYIKTFNELLEPKGYMFIGGHTKENKQFEKGYRISKTTGITSHALDELPTLCEQEGFTLKNTGVFDFQEKTNNHAIIKLKYFLMQKK